MPDYIFTRQSVGTVLENDKPIPKTLGIQDSCHLRSEFKCSRRLSNQILIKCQILVGLRWG